MLNKTLILVEHVDEGIPQPHHFRVEQSEVDTDKLAEEMAEGSILVHSIVSSADPYLRGRIRTVGGMKLGQPMRAFVTGKVLASKNPKWVAGDFFGAELGVSTVQVVTQEQLAATVSWNLTGRITDENITLGVGVLGMPGSTSYAGIEGILRPNQGETIFISAASGAVGGVAGMIAKFKYGCKVIGSAGGPAKCQFVKDFYGFDACIDYKTCSTAEDIVAKVKEVAPEGIDMYFENVGGIHFVAAMKLLRPRGRIAVCGQIAEYNKLELPSYEVNIMGMIYTQTRIEGFVCFEWLAGRKGNWLPEMSEWLSSGKVRAQETVTQGLENWVEAFQSLFTGKNLGKVAVVI